MADVFHDVDVTRPTTTAEALRQIYSDIYRQACPPAVNAKQKEPNSSLPLESKSDAAVSISYILSAYHRPDELACVLYSLKLQTQSDFEVIVTDNSTDPGIAARNRSVIYDLQDARFHYYNPRTIDCYTSAEWAIPMARGEFLCFPSDDSYYMPLFGEVLLKAARNNNLDLAYCNMIIDPRYFGMYWMLDVVAQLNCIDKTGFILRKSKFTRFPGALSTRFVDTDGRLISELVRQGIRHGKVKDILVVHN